MADNDFTLDTFIQQFGLRVREQTGYFAGAPPAPVSARQREALEDGLPLASAIGTEKARSEFIIAPVLDEIRRPRGARQPLQRRGLHRGL